MDPDLIYLAKTDLAQYSTKELELLARNSGIDAQVSKNDLGWLIALNLTSKYKRAEMKSAAELESAEIRNKFSMTKSLGSGSFGDVIEVKVKQDFETPKHEFKKDELYARKTFRYSDKGLTNDAIREINILNSIKHPNIASALATFNMYQNEQCVKAGVIMELAERNLDQVLRMIKLDPQLMLQIMADLACGLWYLHHNHILHNDLKLNNILVKGDTVLIADFGNAIYITSAGVVLGLPHIKRMRAPELGDIDEEGKYGYEADVWALGVIFYQCIKNNPYDYYNYGNDSDRKFIEKLSGPIGDLMQGMLDPDPKTRVSMDTVMEMLKNPTCDDSALLEGAPDSQLAPQTDDRKRKAITSWMRLVIRKTNMFAYGPKYDILFLSINIFDRYLTLKEVANDKLQLVSATAMLLALTIFDVNAQPSAEAMAKYTDNAYTKEEIINFKCEMIQALGWIIYRPSIKTSFPDAENKQLLKCYQKYSSHSKIQACLDEQ